MFRNGKWYETCQTVNCFDNNVFVDIVKKKCRPKWPTNLQKKLCIFSLISIFSLILSGKEFFHGLHWILIGCYRTPKHWRNYEKAEKSQSLQCYSQNILREGKEHAMFLKKSDECLSWLSNRCFVYTIWILIYKGPFISDQCSGVFLYFQYLCWLNQSVLSNREIRYILSNQLTRGF